MLFLRLFDYELFYFFQLDLRVVFPTTLVYTLCLMEAVQSFTVKPLYYKLLGTIK